MAYTRLHWVESETPLSADNMNNIEDGIEELQSQKVDKVSGKALSDNNYTSAEKTKLAGIEAGAEVNVQPDWNQTDTTADDYIQNKPGNASSSTAGFMTAADKSKLDGVQAGAQVNPGVATTSANGLMSSSDKTKINGIETGATKTPDIKIQGSLVTDNKLEIVFNDPLTVTKEQTAVPGTTTTTETIGVKLATTTLAGLMSATDKTKLNGIASGATRNTAVATASANGLMAAEDKAKLDSIEIFSLTARYSGSFTLSAFEHKAVTFSCTSTQCTLAAIQAIQLPTGVVIGGIEKQMSSGNLIGIIVRVYALDRGVMVSNPTATLLVIRNAVQ